MLEYRKGITFKDEVGMDRFPRSKEQEGIGISLGCVDLTEHILRFYFLFEFVVGATPSQNPPSFRVHHICFIYLGMEKKEIIMETKIKVGIWRRNLVVEQENE